MFNSNMEKSEILKAVASDAIYMVVAAMETN